MWCPDCQKEVVFGAAGPKVQSCIEAGEIIWGGRDIPAPCPVCGNPLGWERVLPGPSPKASQEGDSPGKARGRPHE